MKRHSETNPSRASLAYGFEHSFSSPDRKLLSLLHLFQGYVNSNVLLFMCKGPVEWALPELRDISKANISHVLDTAAEIGLLTARGGEHYSIHPAVPRFLKRHFDHYYPSDVSPDSARAAFPATRAFVETMGHFGHNFLMIYELGGRRDLGHLIDEEPNFLNAIAFSLAHEWWRPAVACLEGLFPLYQQTGRRAAWLTVFSRVVPFFLANDERPIPGREAYWSIFMDYRLRQAMEAQTWPEAERLASAIIDNERPLAVPLLNVEPSSLDAQQSSVIRGFATALGRLGDVRRERQDPRCLEAYREAIQLYQHIDEKMGEATRCFNVGHAYKNIGVIQDLDQAEVWYRRSLNLRPEHDKLARGQCLAQLGSLALKRLTKAKRSDSADEVLIKEFTAAVDFYKQALELIPVEAVGDIANLHNQLGIAYANSRKHLDLAIEHLQEALRSFEALGEQHMAGGVRNNLAMILLAAGRVAEARDYAEAAITTLEKCRVPSDELIRSAKNVRRDAERRLQLEAPPPDTEHI